MSKKHQFRLGPNYPFGCLLVVEINEKNKPTGRISATPPDDVGLVFTKYKVFDGWKSYYDEMNIPYMWLQGVCECGWTCQDLYRADDESDKAATVRKLSKTHFQHRPKCKRYPSIVPV